MNEEVHNEIRRGWDAIAKPLDGFGDFEEIICRLGAIFGKRDFTIDKRCAVIFCADNGIVEEGVSQTGKEVTYQVATALGKGLSTANTLGRSTGCECLPVDIGIDTATEIPGVRDLKVRRGTGNFLKEDAMTEDEVLKAIGTGIDLAKELKEAGKDILLAGEMGIGNTTTASVLVCLLLGLDPEEIVGRGAGLDDEGLKRKQEVVKKALLKYGAQAGKEGALDNGAVICNREQAFKYLCQVGGLDIAGLCGLFIGGGIYGIPVVIDGLITAVAALLAECFVPGVKCFFIPSHCGREKGLRQVLECLGLNPFLDGNMALGESTGAMMLMPLLDAALSFYTNASTFGEEDIKEYQRFQ